MIDGEKRKRGRGEEGKRRRGGVRTSKRRREEGKRKDKERKEVSVARRGTFTCWPLRVQKYARGAEKFTQTLVTLAQTAEVASATTSTVDSLNLTISALMERRLIRSL